MEIGLIIATLSCPNDTRQNTRLGFLVLNIRNLIKCVSVIN